MTVRLLVVDDSPQARAAILTALARVPEFEVVGEAADGHEALAQVRALSPDMVLMDRNMPRCDGLLATRLIRQQFPQVAVVILTVSDDPTDLFTALQNGARGYLPKSLPPADWLAYLRSLARGDQSVPKAMAGRILSALQPADGPEQSAPGELTEREVEVLRLVGRALTNREIATTLMISEQTVKNHIKNLLAKLHCKNRVDLALYARHLPPEDGLDAKE